MEEEGETNQKFLSQLKLSKADNRQLKIEKSKNVHLHSIDLPELDGDGIVLDCRRMLQNPNPYMRIIAVACLTGRRMAEIVHSVDFTKEPVEQHYTSSAYWANITGICKQRKGDPGAIKTIEVPFLDTRCNIAACVASIRRDLPSPSVKYVNRKYGKPVQRAMQKYCPNVKKIHQFRKMYVLLCHHYFNERKCSLPRLAADYLGHKTMSESVITYLNFRLAPLGKLDFGSVAVRTQQAQEKGLV